MLCVYRDIYLLDDPLSAVDVHVGSHIFDKCIKSGLSKKTVVLVSHQVQYLRQCDEVFVMKDGRVSDSGTHEQLVESCHEYNLMMQAGAGVEEQHQHDPDDK
jgi:ABC-type multidrug transport system fused ATPase/permease subunit